jgi:DNA-binding LytR/AlgR family response regulator
MEKLSCIAVDDEVSSLNILEVFLKNFQSLHLISTFRNPIEAQFFLQNNKIDILFIDIQMPRLNGIQFLNSIEKKPITIFTTAYSEFALDAFDLDAADYLKKPFSFERFSKAVEKAIEIFNYEKIKQNDVIIDDTTYDSISIKTEGKIVKLFFSEIIYVQAFQEYIKIFTDRGRFITYDRMKNIENILPGKIFLRVHRSYIVSLSRVKSISGNLVEVDSHLIPISRPMKEELIRRIF